MYSLNSLIDQTSWNELKRNLNEFGYIKNLTNERLVIDSRNAESDTIFCAYAGIKADGRNYIPQAIKQGCKKILFAQEFHSFISSNGVIQLGVPQLQHYVGMIASLKYRNFLQQNIIGVTGTNGKSSITHWIAQVALLLKLKCGIIGTLGAGIYPELNNISCTTPDPIILHQIIAQLTQCNMDLLALEVSSHALNQGRVNGLNFKIAIFTNLTQDHLNYHQDMEHYFKAKTELFAWHNLELAIINIDDSYGYRLIKNLNSKIKLISYGLSESAQLRAFAINNHVPTLEFKIIYNNEELEIKSSLMGLFNIYNLLAVIAVYIAQGIKLANIIKIIPNLNCVTGRMERIKLAQQALVIIDYAHTPDALKQVLITLRQGLTQSAKLFCVFGCGGERDKTKRAIMGNVASSYADSIIITSDNPRSEDPQAIINDILVGVKNHNYQIIENRQQAIIQALIQANTTDIVLIAGKGHEQYQEINGVKYFFDDKEVVRHQSIF